ncbi:MAG: SDR family oxidoreductase [Sulfurospirillum sp.]|nr:SDR family oxidoreductase [Sulfurospirillum sp.]
MHVLLTGVTGYIGRRLMLALMQNPDIKIRVLVRHKQSISGEFRDDIEICEGDAKDPQTLRAALKNIDVAYYFLHSLNESNYKQKDKQLAQSFIDIAATCKVKKVIYLGGLGVKNANTSEHLLSRLETGEVLSSNAHIKTVWFRAGVVIGSGSASFEIIRHLAEKLPLMITPKWVATLAQPIGVDDVLSYLIAALPLETDKNLIIDIGSQQMSYKDMMIQTASVLGLKRYIFPVPLMSINLSSYWLNLFTPVPFKVAKALIEGLKSEVTVQNDNAKKYFPNIHPQSYKKAVKKAIFQIKENQVISRWNDNAGKIWDRDHEKEFANALFMDRKVRNIDNLSNKEVFDSFTAIGGENGWFDYDFLWEIRGIMDKMMGGVGLKRGRRSECDLRISDCLDFWRVIDIKKDERLLLYAQMIVPGNAWLEFKIKDKKLIQSAYFYPKGIWGRLYWYALIPIHWLVFNNMIEGILKRAQIRQRPTFPSQ